MMIIRMTFVYHCVYTALCESHILRAALAILTIQMKKTLRFREIHLPV